MFVFENRNSGKRWCYVSQPSDCNDLVDSTVYDMHQWSFQACDEKPGRNDLLLLVRFNSYYYTNTTYILQSVLALQFLTGLEDCTCYDFVDEDGYGNCLKGHPNKNGLLVCYVKQPTSCNDTIDNLSLPGREISSLAC